MRRSFSPVRSRTRRPRQALSEPGTTIVLDVGDQFLAPSGVSFRRRNDGLTSATMLCFSIGTYGDSARIWSSPPGVTYAHGLPFKLLSAFPAVPVEATVHRLTLAPGAELAIRDLPGLELVYVEAGALDLVYAKAETPATPERVLHHPRGEWDGDLRPHPRTGGAGQSRRRAAGAPHRLRRPG